MKKCFFKKRITVSGILLHFLQCDTIKPQSVTCSFIFNRGAENEERIKSQVQCELESVISEDNYKACKKKK